MAVRVKEGDVPAVVGEPEIVAVLPKMPRDSPGGRSPKTPKVKVPLPPLAVMVWLYGVPTTPAGRLVSESVIAGLTRME